jgi:PAS domain S-box-containing protein
MRELLHVFPDRSDGWIPKSKAVTILNVDDNPVARQLRTRILRRGGFEILEAGCGAEALRLAKETLPSLILLDVRMPDINGFAVCRRIRSDPRTAGIPVLHISSLGKTEHGYPGALDSGSDAYVKEPVYPELLIDLSRSLIRAAAAEKALNGCPLFEAAVHGGPIRNGELSIRAPDGEEISVACNIAEGRLLEATLNSAVEGMAIVDTAGNIVRMNRAASVLFGIPDGERTPRHMADLHQTIDFTWLDGTVLSREESPVLRSALGDTILGLDMLVRIKATGECRVVSYRSAPVCDSQGTITHVVVNVHDITDRKKEEEECRQNEFRWNTLAETVPDILLTSSDGLTWDYVNQRAVEYTGLSVGSMSGSGWREVVCRDDLGDFLAAAELSRKTGKSLDHEVRFRGADGMYRWFRVRFDPLHDAGGTIVKWVGAASNVDDLKRLEQQLGIKTHALEELNARLLESNRDLQ